MLDALFNSKRLIVLASANSSARFSMASHHLGKATRVFAQEQAPRVPLEGRKADKNGTMCVIRYQSARRVVRLHKSLGR